tara:strand:- start:6976 stop:7086 length:111 start_codon:yes stop_codon:yes gene_type:complete
MAITHTKLRAWLAHANAFLRAIWEDTAPTTRTKGGR